MLESSVNMKFSVHKTVGGVVHTRYPLSIHFNGKNA